MANKRLTITKLLNADPLAHVSGGEILIAELTLKGKSPKQIAALIGENESAIAVIVLKLERDWQQLAESAPADKIAKELAKLNLVEAEAWAAWHRSIGKVDTVITKTSEDANGFPVSEKTVKSEIQVGDHKFLRVIERCGKSRRELFGLDKPVKVAQTDPSGETGVGAVFRIPPTVTDVKQWVEQYGDGPCNPLD